MKAHAHDVSTLVCWGQSASTSWCRRPARRTVPCGSMMPRSSSFFGRNGAHITLSLTKRFDPVIDTRVRGWDWVELISRSVSASWKLATRRAVCGAVMVVKFSSSNSISFRE